MRIAISILTFALMVVAQPLKDKALSWQIIARAQRIAALEERVARERAELQRVIAEACQSEGIEPAKCATRIEGDSVIVEEAKK